MNAEDDPIYIEMREIALVVGWNTIRVKRWLRKGGAAVKRNGRWVTNMDLLRDAFPEIWVRLQERLALSRNDQERSGTITRDP